MKDEKTKKVSVPRFPANLLAPVAQFLQGNLKTLEKRRREISSEDPFKIEDRLLDNASPDADAAEQFGHARTSAIKSEITKKIVQVRKALTRIKLGKYGICEECGQMIDTDRLIIYPEAIYCAKDAKKREK